MSVFDPDEEVLNASTAKILSAVAGTVLLGSIVRFGWLSDDAFISFRAVANLLTGHGLVSNPGERVQGFTNPLWTLLMVLPYRLTGDIYGTAIVTSLICCLLTLVLIWRFHRAGWQAAWVFLMLGASMTFVVFSTSGLENPLAHLLLVAFFVASIKAPDRPAILWLLGAFIVVNRLDHVLLVLPLLGATLVRRPRIRWRAAALALLPLVAWLTFSVIYYGFAYPNTAYAKLNVSIGRGGVLAQGLAYVVDSLLTDPLVVLVIVLVVAAVLYSRRLSSPLALHGLGVCSYLAYVCWIGGDFMSGRFLAAPFLVAVLMASLLLRTQPRAAFAVALLALLAGHRVLLPLDSDQATRCPVPPSGIVDERGCFIDYTAIAQNVRHKKYKSHPWYLDGVKAAAEGKRVHVVNVIGMLGFGAGPAIHIVDTYALTDPLLARMTFRPQGNWRPGHLERPLPAHYVESLEQGRNLLTDACARALLDDLWLITRGPVFSRPRWRALVRRNLGSSTCPSPSGT